MVVHTGTTIQSSFLIVDEAGNVVDSKAVTANLQALTDASWAEALSGLRQHRDALAPVPTVPAIEAVPAAVPDEEVSCGS